MERGQADRFIWHPGASDVKTRGVNPLRSIFDEAVGNLHSCTGGWVDGRHRGHTAARQGDLLRHWHAYPSNKTNGRCSCAIPAELNSPQRGAQRAALRDGGGIKVQPAAARKRKLRCHTR